MDQVGVHARAGKDADRSIEALGRMARVFQCFPCAFKKMPVLRVHDRCISWTQAEKRCIEHGDIAEQRGSFDVLRAGQLFSSCAGSDEFGIRAILNGLDAITKIPPKPGNIACAGKSTRHADDCDLGYLHGFRFTAAWLACVAVRALKPDCLTESRQDGWRVNLPW